MFDESSINIFSKDPLIFFLSIKMVRFLTAFINLPSFINDEKKSIFESLSKALDLY